MDPQKHEYGRYYGSQHPPTEDMHQTPPVFQGTPIIDSEYFNLLMLNAKFLKDKHSTDLEEAQRWNTIIRAASGAGYVVILAGIIIALILSAFSGPLIGILAGGLTSLSGILVTIFTNLIQNPARIYNEQVQEDARLLSEEYKKIAEITKKEIEREQFKRSIAGLPKETQEELLKRFVIKEYGLPE